MGSLWTTVALGAVAVAWALPLQSVGCGQNAHYAAARAFAERPRRSSTATRRRHATSCRRGGHHLCLQGAGARLLGRTLVPSCCLFSVGAVPRESRTPGCRYPAAMAGVPLRAIWQIGLWAVVLPGARRCCCSSAGSSNRIEPGTRRRGGGRARARHARAAVLDAAVRARARGAARLRGRSHCSSARDAAQGRRRGRVRRARGRDRPAARSSSPPSLLGLYAVAAARSDGFAAFGGGASSVRRPLYAFGHLGVRQARSGSRTRATAIDPGAGGVEQAHVHGLFFTLTSPHPHLRGGGAAEQARAARALAGARRRQRPASCFSGGAGFVPRRRSSRRSDGRRDRRGMHSARPTSSRSAAGCRARASSFPLLPFLCVRARTGRAPRARDVRSALARDLDRRDGGGDERRAAPVERRHAPLDRAHRRRELRRDCAQPRRASGTAGSRSCRSTRSCSSRSPAPRR